MPTYIWLIIAAVLVAVELSSGTFYLLMLAIAAISSWMAQQLGASFLIQSIVFLITSAFLVSFIHRQKQSTTEPANQASNLDAGEIVLVTNWENGIGHTKYRGAHWQVVCHTPSEPMNDGPYQIVSIDNNRLSVRTASSTH